MELCLVNEIHMRKQTSVVEWYIAENDADWHHLRTSPGATTRGRLSLMRFRGTVLVLLLLLGGASIWRWRSDQARTQRDKAELMATAQRSLAVMPGSSGLAAHGRNRQSDLDDGKPDAQAQKAQVPANLFALGSWYQYARKDHNLRLAVQVADPAGHLEAGVQTIDVQGDKAVVEVVLLGAHGTPAYRQTRFYRRTAHGWQQTTVDADLWGPVRSLETPSFVFHFRQNDATAVVAVAAQLETLYATLRQNFGLPFTPTADKVDIEVSVTQTPGGEESSWFQKPARFVVASPARYSAPVEMTDAELLAQSLALPLLALVLSQASERYQISPAWQPMVSGLYLWQMWDIALPLSVWREEVVKWLYLDQPHPPHGQAIVLPKRYTALCAAHQLWMSSPMQINIPFVCQEGDWEAWYWASWSSSASPTRLEQFMTLRYPDEYVAQSSKLAWGNHPGQVVALATLIDYAVATYGRERLPALLAGLGQYQSWDTLIPVVYGLSPAQFEAGWQAYLAGHYGVAVTTLSK